MSRARRWPLLLAALVSAPLPAAPLPAAPHRATAGSATPPPRPNIVVLLADDWGYSDVGSFGGEIRTPNIDALAGRGVRFTNFHVAGSCSPTRAMLQTGVRNHRAGLGNMPETIPPEHVGKPGYDTVLNDRVVTLAQLLHGHGYRTYFTGKWHLGKTSDKLPHTRGYDHAFALADSGADNFEQKPIIGLYDKADWTEDGRPATLPTGFYSSTFLVDKAISYIDAGRTSGRPFFASINFLANHIPIQAPAADLARYRNAYRAGWEATRQSRRAKAIALGVIPGGSAMIRMGTTAAWPDAPDAAAAMTAYAAMAEAADREIGRLVAHLRVTGAYDNTVFVFLSDNGPEPTNPRGRLINRLFLGAYYDFTPAHAGQRGTLTALGPSWASAAAAPLRGYKFTADEGGLRVPLVIAWPGNPAIRAGTMGRGYADVTDVAPTLLALADVAAPGLRYRGRAIEPMTGTSLLPMLLGNAGFVHPDDQPIGYELSGNAALFKGRWKLVKTLPPTGDGGWRLYDIVADPGETHDLMRRDPQRARAMRADYDAFARRDGILPMPPGYTADNQISANALAKFTRLAFARAAPLIALVLAGLAAAVAWRWRRRAAVRR